jgi:hypothetical protein
MTDLTGWSIERLHADHAQGLRVDVAHYDSATDHQRIRVFENPTFGRIMTLDGVVQVTEADNFIYHEMLTHVPILAHGHVRRVLIVGGGDGGMAREVLKHDGIEQVTMVEIDGAVVDFCREYLPGISAGAFDDPRLDLVIADGADFMAKNRDEYDVIIIDSTDPVGPGEVLFTDSFYGHAKARLCEGRHSGHAKRCSLPAGWRTDRHDARVQGTVCGRDLLSGHGADLCGRAHGFWLGNGWQRAPGDTCHPQRTVCCGGSHHRLLHTCRASGRLRPATLCGPAHSLKPAFSAQKTDRKCRHFQTENARFPAPYPSGGME